MVFIICENTVHSLILSKVFFLQRSKDLYKFPTFSNLCDFLNFKNVFKNLQFDKFEFEYFPEPFREDEVLAFFLYNFPGFL